MTGHDVLHPMGWDAFGLPAENAALERGVHPGEWTLSNITKMKEQLISMGAQFDWDKEFMTCSPSFYKHTQRIFLMLYERGLAYQAEAMVNWDPVDKTVLANEQVDANGCSWRSGAKVEKIMLKQWFLRITAFQDSLLQGIDSLLDKGTWPERVLTQQKHWLGKSEGAKIQFTIESDDVGQRKVEVFTTRPDTLFGVQFVALALSHPIVKKIAEEDEQLREFIRSAVTLPPESKAGYRLSGVHAVNPLLNRNNAQSDTDKGLPVFAAPYVLSDYGEGAVMGVPGHDTRDWAFWIQHGLGELPKVVVEPASEPTSIAADRKKAPSTAYTDRGVLNHLCGDYAGLESKEAGRKIVGELFGNGDADVAQNWRLRDWLVSRQRYWGTPIPFVHCDDCGPVPVPVEQLPVELPDLSELPPGTTGNPLTHISSFAHTSCPKCRGPAKRDTDTMDTFVDSSWYYMRFPDAKNDAEPFSLKSAERDLPVDIYVGGVEHAILHLLYARFIYKFLVSEGLVPQSSETDEGLVEPFRHVISQGMVHGKTFSDPSTGRFLRPSEVDFDAKGTPVLKGTDTKPNISFEKMSKSKYNGVDPKTCIEKYGADATRAHMLFSAPVSEVLEWDEEKIVGIQRWFNRITRLVESSSINDPSNSEAGSLDLTTFTLPTDSIPHLNTQDINVLLALNATVESVDRTLSTNPYALNTTISDLTKLTHTLTSYTSPSPHAISTLHLKPQALSILLRLLAPIAPTFTQQCWAKLLHHEDHQISNTPFPPSPLLPPGQISHLLSISQTSIQCTVQINGKLRFNCQITPPAPTSSPTTKEEEEETIIQQILATEQGRQWLTEKNRWEKRKRVIVVRGGKVVNFVF